MSFDNFKQAIGKNAPTLISIGACAGIVGVGVTSFTAGVKTAREIDNFVAENKRKPTKKETFKLIYKHLIPAVFTGGLSIAGVLISNRMSANRLAAVAGAYSLADETLKAYEKKVVEKIGSEEAKQLKDEVVKEKKQANDEKRKDDGSVRLVDGSGTLCYDSVSDRYFRSTPEKINKAINELNRCMMSEMYVSLNDFYDKIDLRHITIGDDLGWNIDDGLIEVTFSAGINDEDKPFLILDYTVRPRYDYRNLH